MYVSESIPYAGNKISARNLAIACGVPVLPTSGPLPDDSTNDFDGRDYRRLSVMIKAALEGSGRA